jgi:hypothetical protein
MIHSETGMAQANTGGGVEEPDPMVLKMMIQTVAKSGRILRARAYASVMCAAQQTMVYQV